MVDTGKCDCLCIVTSTLNEVTAMPIAIPGTLFAGIKCHWTNCSD